MTRRAVSLAPGWSSPGEGRADEHQGLRAAPRTEERLRFGCAQCGKCCHDLRLPMTVAEAIEWLSSGLEVQVLCEAVPWPTEPPADDARSAHKRRRSFEAPSGQLPTRVVAILAGAFAGPCPRLDGEGRCGAYDRRPLVCQIYPAEINPFIELDPAAKVCPPEAWGNDRPLLASRGRVVDPHVQALVRLSRNTDAREVDLKERLCASLGLQVAAIASEGFVVHSPGREVLLRGLRDVLTAASPPTGGGSWRLVSNQQATVDHLASVGAVSSLPSEEEAPGLQYLGFLAPAPGLSSQVEAS